MKTEKQGLWYKVLSYKYGEVDEGLGGSMRDASLGWRDVFSIQEEVWALVGIDYLTLCTRDKEMD